MQDSPDIETFVGDTSPNITFSVIRGTTIVDLTNATVKFLLFNPATSAQSNTGNTNCSITNALGGQCIYVWGANDKPNEGVYRGYLQITFPGSRPETGEVRVNVRRIGF